MMGFLLSVAAADRVCYRGTALACTVETTTGSRTFEAHHEPFVALLAPGAISIVEEEGRRRSIPVEDGLVRFDGNVCSIVVGAAGGFR